MPFHLIYRALRIVYHNPFFVALSAFTIAFMVVTLVFLTSIPGQSLDSWLFSAPPTTQFLVVFSSIILSIMLAVQTYTWTHYRQAKKRATGSGLAGLASTIVATACCSPLLLPLAGLAGFGSIIFFVQSHTVFVVLVSSAILLIGLYYSCKALDCQDCQVKTRLVRRK
jgi:hypothetical protein